VRVPPPPFWLYWSVVMAWTVFLGGLIIEQDRVLIAGANMLK
jgi:hypothetical protein